MTEAKKTWTGHIQLGSKIDISVILNQLCQALIVLLFLNIMR